MKQLNRILPLLTTLVLVLGCFAGLAQPAHAETAGYSLWIGGVQVTEENADDVFGDGRVRFTPAGEDGKAILALNGYSYRGEGTLVQRETGINSAALLYQDTVPLEIRLTGENSLLQSADKTVRLAAGLYSTAENTELSLVGTDSGASLKLAAGSAEKYSGALQVNGSLRVQSLRLQAEGGEAGAESDGVYCVSSFVIRDSEVSAASGVCTAEDSGSSCAISCWYDMTIEHSRLTLTGGDSYFCIGLWNHGELLIYDSELSAESVTSCDYAAAGYPLLADKSVSIQRSSVKATAAGADYNYALQSRDEGIVVLDSSLTLKSGAAPSGSVGVSTAKSLIVGGASTMTALASDTPLTGEEQSYSCGIEAPEGILISGSGTKLKAVGGTGDTAYGLCSDNCVIISDEVASVEAASPSRAVWGKLKNAVAGVGWTEPDGSAEATHLPADEEGAELPDYRRLRFGMQIDNPFSDVKDGAFYSDAVLWAVNAAPQITTGTGETTFSPNESCTRAQVVTFLWRAAGKPRTGSEPGTDVKSVSGSPVGNNPQIAPKSINTNLKTASQNPFADVNENAYYYDAVLWAVEQGVTKGTSDTEFSPKQSCTRGQVVTFLWRAAGSPLAGSESGIDVKSVSNNPVGSDPQIAPKSINTNFKTASQNPFADVNENAYYYDAVLWAVEQGVTRGTSDTEFSPNLSCTRGQVVTFLYRARQTSSALPYRYASREEAAELLLAEHNYCENLNQNDLNYRVQKFDATLDEWKELVRQQTRDYTEREKDALDEAMLVTLGLCRLRGYRLPKLYDVVFAKTTMAEECDAGAYTHGTHIFLGTQMLAYGTHEMSWYRDFFHTTVAHELFHCLTRNDPDFRREMYALLGFTVGQEIEFSQEIKESIISNPDVGHHDAYASFEIDGAPRNCVAIFTADPFTQPGDSFFNSMQTRLVPIDDPSVSYSSEEAANFWDVFGRNTDYVIDPEEALADNFSYAVIYGTDREYQTPELIEAIISCLQTREA